MRVIYLNLTGKQISVITIVTCACVLTCVGLVVVSTMVNNMPPQEFTILGKEVKTLNWLSFIPIPAETIYVFQYSSSGWLEVSAEDYALYDVGDLYTVTYLIARNGGVT